jgi:hypothetical protein
MITLPDWASGEVAVVVGDDDLVYTVVCTERP